MSAGVYVHNCIFKPFALIFIHSIESKFEILPVTVPLCVC